MTESDAHNFGLLVGVGVGIGIGAWLVFTVPFAYVVVLLAIGAWAIKQGWETRR